MHREETDLNQATRQARQWFECNRHCFRYYLPERDDRTWEDVFDELLDLVTDTFHLDLLSEAFEARMLPETRDRAPEPRQSASESARHAIETI